MPSQSATEPQSQTQAPIPSTGTESAAESSKTAESSEQPVVTQ